MMITEPGIYTMPAADYHADPCPEPSLNNSVARHLVHQSPAHAYAAHPRLGNEASMREKRNMTLGSAAHSVILEQSWEPIVFVDAPNFTTKDARLKRDEALAAGLLPLLEKDRATVSDMVLAIHNAGLFDASMRELSQFEATLCWREGPSWHRCRVDCIYRGDDGEPDTLYDLKTTAIDATPDGWGRSAIWDYALQAAWYTRGYEELTGRMANFVFIVQETKPPYGVRQFRFSLTGEAYGRDLADRAADLWARCMARGEWPSYPAGVVTVQAPGWIAAQVGEGVRG